MNWGMLGVLLGRMWSRREDAAGRGRREQAQEGSRPNLAGAAVLAGMGLIALLFWRFD